jgi:ectoine hydroxylase
VLTGEQAGANMERVEEVLKVLPLDYVVMDPGDVFYFHANLLHRSDQNRSENPRWSMICCYNAARNNPYKEAHHPRYTPLAKLPDSEILAAGNKRFAESDEGVWIDNSKDVSATSLQNV